MSLSNNEVIKRFGNGATTGHSLHMFIDGDCLYDYGHHFPLLTRMRQTSDNFPEGEEWILMNADKYSVTTSQHQAQAHHLATVLIPHSALSAAGLTFPSRQVEACRDIRLVAKSAEKYEDRQYTNARGEIVKYQERRPEACVLEFKGKYYLSSMDNGRYFITLLPSKVESVQDALDSLAPTYDREKMKTVLRQGEWFFLPTDKQPDRSMGKAIKGRIGQVIRFLKNRNKDSEPHHYATEYFVNPALYEAGNVDAPVLVRGTVRHVNGDHKMLKLGDGKTWYKAVESWHVQSWGARGNVD